MCTKFQVQKIYTKKVMQDLPTWGSCEKSFTATNFDTLPRIEEIFFAHEIFGVKTPLCCLHVWKISSPKDPHKK